MSFALFSSPPSTAHLPPYSAAKLQSPLKPISLSFKPKRLALLGGFTCAAEDAAVTVEAEKVDAELKAPEALEKEEEEEPAGSNGSVKKASAAAGGAPAPLESEVVFQDPKWVAGTWDLTQFQKDGKTDWDAVIDAEAKRRKWLELNPESSNNESPVVFDTSIIPWWAWVKRYHLPEAELLNGRAAMVGFFMAYFADSLTGVGLVDQMGNFFCKTLLFVAVVGVLVIRKNEDIETVKKLLEESTFYDKQWQATWQDEKKKDS